MNIDCGPSMWYSLCLDINMRLVVRTGFIAVMPEDDGQFRFITLRAGSIIEIVGEVQRSGLVDIEYEGRTLAAFIRDIEDKTERIRAASA